MIRPVLKCNMMIMMAVMVFNDNSDEKTIIVVVYRDCFNEITITTTCLSHISFSQVS